MSVKKRGLGRGLDALLSSSGPGAGADSAEELRELALDAIQAGAHQPRRHFDDEALQELATSIAAQGVIQPIVVRPLAANRFEIVAGERRWRAARLAGLSLVPAVVRQLDDRAAMAVAIVENIQRADLNPIEEAEALQRLAEEGDLTHEQIAQALGRSRATVTNLLRVLDLPLEVRDLVRLGRLTLGHAKVLLGVPAEAQAAVAAKVVERALTVRQTEQMLRAAPPAAAPRPPASPIERALADKVGLPVKVQAAPGGGGRVTIRYRDLADLERLLGRLH